MTDTVSHRRQRLSLLLLSLLLLIWVPSAGAWYPRLVARSTVAIPRAGILVGENRPYLVGPGETLMEIAYRGGLGYRNLLQANPGLDPWAPPAGTDLRLPYAALLPPDIGPGITINLAEYRLYLVWPEDGRWRVRIYPIGLGREGWETPEGDFEVTSRVKGPIWTPPDSLRAEKPDLPHAIPPGPGNPLGDYWIGLSAPGVGIHGTNQPYGVGRRVSHGCIRLYPRDIEDLVERVEKGMPVRIRYRPFKAGVVNGMLLFEIHPDYLGRFTDPAAEIRRQARALGWQGDVAGPALTRELRERHGIPLILVGGRERLASTSRAKPPTPGKSSNP
jgi:L,D-transpeptidase ErfK/SrfK